MLCQTGLEGLVLDRCVPVLLCIAYCYMLTMPNVCRGFGGAGIQHG